MYASGRGVKQDYVEAVKWYRKAADQGSANAQYFLGVIYADGLGVKRDYLEAVEWFKKACDNKIKKGCKNYKILNEAGL